MKTPMQELIEQLKEEKDLHGYEKQGYFETAIELAESMLEKEKEVIVKAYESGCAGVFYELYIGEEYYNETFNTKENG
jgi:hypothetical protein